MTPTRLVQLRASQRSSALPPRSRCAAQAPTFRTLARSAAMLPIVFPSLRSVASCNATRSASAFFSPATSAIRRASPNQREPSRCYALDSRTRSCLSLRKRNLLDTLFPRAAATLIQRISVASCAPRQPAAARRSTGRAVPRLDHGQCRRHGWMKHRRRSNAPCNPRTCAPRVSDLTRSVTRRNTSVMAVLELPTYPLGEQ